jgi:hypothetical protein
MSLLSAAAWASFHYDGARPGAGSGQLDGDYLPVIYVANAQGLRADTITARNPAELKEAFWMTSPPRRDRPHRDLPPGAEFDACSSLDEAIQMANARSPRPCLAPGTRGRV